MVCVLFNFHAQALEWVQLEGDVGLPKVTAVLEPTQRQAIEARQMLRLGVTQAGYEPLEVLRGQSVKGITPDYLTIVASSLGLQVQVRVYSDWTAALAGLSSGEVDVLGRGSSYEQQLPGVLLSNPYTENQPVLVGRSGDLGDDALSDGGRMAVVNGYAPLSTLTARFPGVKFEEYATVREALHALEYDGAQWLVCDGATVAYHLASGELPSLRMRPLSEWHPAGYGFIFRSEDAALRDAFDRVLEAIPRLAQAEILEHWGVNSRFDSARVSAFTSEQLTWLATRPEVRVVVNGGTPPYSFYDDDGQFRGLLADMLAEISQRTGMRFKFIEQSTLKGVLESMRDGEGDMTTMLLPTPERQKMLYFTEPYANSSFALVGPRAVTFKNLSELKGLRVAMVKNSAVIQYMEEHHPGSRLVLTDSYLETLMAVADGQADAAVMLLPVSRYMINQYFTKKLRVITSLPQMQAALSFAVTKDNPMLYGVMEAALNRLEPRFIGGLVERWQNSLPAESSVWGGYERRQQFFILTGGASFLLLLAWQGYAWLSRIRDRAEKARQSFRSALLDGIPQPVVVRDLRGCFVLCNHTFFSVFGLEPEQVIGRTWSEVEGLDSAPEGVQKESYQALLAHDRAIDIQQIVLNIRGEIFTFRQWAVPHRGADGRTAGLLMGWVDMSATQRLMQQLQEVRDQAVQANEAKSRFLAVMSHEIRTPLNAIIGLLELTMERVDRGEDWDRAAIEVAYSSSGSLMLLIGDILDLAKIEAGKLSLEPERKSPQEILESVQRIFHGLARQKGLYLEVDLQVDSSRDVWVDGGRLKQVLSNLLSNAIKFTDKGGIQLSLQAKDAGPDLHVVFVVKDSGIGISSLDKERLFEPFSQASGTSGQRGGTGLGLVICKQLVEMMGGNLTLQSEPGIGSRITVDLLIPALEPLPPDQIAPLPTLNDAPSLNVLLVDDHPPNRLLLRQQLLFLGHRVVEAEDGHQAFSCIQNQSFDVVITDCNMPVMDGYELTRLIRNRAQESNNAPCPIVGFTANAQVEERQRCLEVGMNDCLFKPVRLNTLRTCLEGVTNLIGTPLANRKNDDEQLPESLSALLDMPMLESLTGGNQQVFQMLLTELHASNRIDLQQLEDLFVAERWNDLGRVVHRLKGGARMVGAHQLVEATRAYERSRADALILEEVRLRALAVHAAVVRLQAAIAERLTPS